MVKKRFDGWLVVSVLLLLLFIAVLIYPMFGVIKQAVIMPDGSFSWEQFHKFFSNSYYVDTLYNSFKITIFVTVLTLVIGIPFAYFYAFYRLKGAKILFVVSILCCMSAPFLGAYSWVMLLGRSGVITKFFKTALGITLPSIYGFGGIALSQTLKFFPLVFIYMNGAFKSIDNTLMEASANMGCTAVKRLEMAQYPHARGCIVAVDIQYVRVQGVDKLCEVILKKRAPADIRPDGAADDLHAVALGILPVARGDIVTPEKAREIIGHTVKPGGEDHRFMPHAGKVFGEDIYLVPRVGVKEILKLYNLHVLPLRSAEFLFLNTEGAQHHRAELNDAPAVLIIGKGFVLAVNERLQLLRAHAELPGDILKVGAHGLRVVAGCFQLTQRFVARLCADEYLIGEIALSLVIAELVRQVITLVKAGEHVLIVLVGIRLPAEALREEGLDLLLVVLHHVQRGDALHALENGVIKAVLYHAAHVEFLKLHRSEAALNVLYEAQVVLIHPLYRRADALGGTVRPGEHLFYALVHRVVLKPREVGGTLRPGPARSPRL